MLQVIRHFLKLESASGILLVTAAILAMIAANSPLAWLYDSLITIPFEIRLGEVGIDKPLLLWINDGLMALFFLLVGLELKREIVCGQISSLRKAALPLAGAVGGMLIPALIYVWINWGDAVAMQGWAIPAATDIAFALAILALLGDRVPASLRILLVSVAIFDDIGAIVIIALFYTSGLSNMALIAAAACLLALFFMNRRGVLEKTPYLLVGLVMWVAVLKSGVHATLAGVVLAMFIPYRAPDGESSPLEELEHDLDSGVAYFILPLFAFANAGVTLKGVSLDFLLHPVPLGVAAGLFFGKQLGVFGFCWLSVKVGLAKLPEDLSWGSVYGASLLCGIGFTMSLFLASLAFETSGVNLLFDERLGIIAGSLISGLAGYFILRAVLPTKAAVP
ncbi:MAG: Na+/H+ antiporter NhaA [Woeseia sp.]|nr:Na+/H+ antiporter NhaA [Woeseia sp.]